MQRFLFLLILLVSTASAASALVVDDEQACRDGELVVEDSLVIRAGGRLILEDCVLVLDALDYEDAWITQDASLQGMLVHVEEGGTLEVRARGGEAGLRPADQTYEYSLLVDGSLVLEGTEGHPVTVSGLEGYVVENKWKGGVHATGDVSMTHVVFDENQGPALLLEDSQARLEHVRARNNTGAFVVRDSVLELVGVDVDVGNVALVTQRSTVDIADSWMFGNELGFRVFRTDLTVHDTTLGGSRAAIHATDTNVSVHGSELRYGSAGIAHDHGSSFEGHTRILVRDSEIISRLGDPYAIGITIDHADLDVENATLTRYARGGVVHEGGSIRFVDSDLDGSGPFHLYTERPDAYEFAGNDYSRNATMAIVYAAPMTLQVVDAQGPVANATVDLFGKEHRTGPDGHLSFTAQIPFADESTRSSDVVEVLVTEGNRSRAVEIPLSQEVWVVDLDARNPPARGAPGPSFVIVGLALVAVVAVRRW